MIKDYYTGQPRPKLICRFRMGSHLFLCEGNQIWSCLDGLWYFYAHAYEVPVVHEPIKPMTDFLSGENSQREFEYNLEYRITGTVLASIDMTIAIYKQKQAVKKMMGTYKETGMIISDGSVGKHHQIVLPMGIWNYPVDKRDKTITVTYK